MLSTSTRASAFVASTVTVFGDQTTARGVINWLSDNLYDSARFVAANAALAMAVGSMGASPSVMAGGLHASAATSSSAKIPANKVPNSVPGIERKMTSAEQAYAHLGSVTYTAPPPPSVRIDLCKQAAKDAGLEQMKMGLDWRHLYAIAVTESGWIGRDGFGVGKPGTANGEKSFGIMQLSATTAQSLGVVNPNNHAEALAAAAQILKEYAYWARSQSISPSTDIESLSLYYNLSTSARNRAAQDLNSVKDPQSRAEFIKSLPQATQHHITNFRYGFNASNITLKSVHNDLARMAKVTKEYKPRDHGQFRVAASSRLPSSAHESMHATLDRVDGGIAKVAAPVSASLSWLREAIVGASQDNLANHHASASRSSAPQTGHR